MSRRPLVSEALRTKLVRQLQEIHRADDDEFARRLAAAAHLMPDEASQPGFAVFVGKLPVPDGESFAAWKAALPRRWAALLQSVGRIRSNFVAEGEPDERGLDALAKLLVRAHRNASILQDWSRSHDG